MQSKWEYFHNLQNNTIQWEGSEYEKWIYSEQEIIRSINGGTLGRLYEIPHNRILKAQIGEVKNLYKECKILKKLYGDMFEVMYKQQVVEGEVLAYYIMPKLEEGPVCRLEEMQEILKEIRSKKLDIADMINYSWEILEEKIKYAEQLLLQKEYISTRTMEQCAEYIRQADPFSIKICHGDLSNKNIMYYEERPVLIDWEDAMWGPESYDLIYWLTFLDQRHYYASNLADRIGVKVEYMKGLMIKIILLKSALSVKNGSIKNHRILVEDRIKEIIRM